MTIEYVKYDRDIENCLEQNETGENESNNKDNRDKTSITLIRSVNGIWKLHENTKENFLKNRAIALLRNYNYRTNYNKIATCLIDIFGISEKHPEHWHYVACHYTPKSINSVLNYMFKSRQNGATPLKTPGAYFTSTLINFHKPRMSYRKGAHKKYKEKYVK